MTKKDILFDDFSILTKLIGKNEVIKSSPTTDCDCTSYSSHPSDEELNTDQVTPSFDKTN